MILETMPTPKECCPDAVQTQINQCAFEGADFMHRFKEGGIDDLDDAGGHDLVGQDQLGNLFKLDIGIVQETGDPCCDNRNSGEVNYSAYQELGFFQHFLFVHVFPPLGYFL
jgi:hypothetical protein